MLQFILNSLAKIVFIAPYPKDGAPSQRFRFEQYLTILKEQGHEVHVASFFSEKGWKKLYREGGTLSKAMTIIGSMLRRFFFLFTLGKYDHIFIHREAAMIGPPVFEWIIAKVLRRSFIYDFDDAIWLPNYSESNAKFHRLKMYRKVNKIMKWASKITAGNAYLADYAKQFNSKVEVIPTTIDLQNLHKLGGNPDQAVPVIGWTGTHTTAQYLQDLLPVLDELIKENSFIFRVISNQAPDFERPYLDFVKWNKETEIEDLATFNIGVMPLIEDEWSKGKCGFKGLQYMALGIPAVMSPVGVNCTIVQNGKNGYLCSDKDSWYTTLRQLLSDSTLRKTIGSSGKQTVIDDYSVESNATKYLNLFK